MNDPNPFRTEMSFLKTLSLVLVLPLALLVYILMVETEQESTAVEQANVEQVHKEEPKDDTRPAATRSMAASGPKREPEPQSESPVVTNESPVETVETRGDIKKAYSMITEKLKSQEVYELGVRGFELKLGMLIIKFEESSWQLTPYDQKEPTLQLFRRSWLGAQAMAGFSKPVRDKIEVRGYRSGRLLGKSDIWSTEVY